MNRLAGKTALVTAAGQGIGRAIADQFALEGATVIATDVNAVLLEGFAGRVETLNILEKPAITALLSSLECNDDQWQLAFDLNVRSQFWTIGAALPGMLEHGHGSIVNISSVASSLKGFPNRFAYSASKAAILGLTKSVAADFVTRGVRCNAICPGTIESPSWQSRVLEQARLNGEDVAAVKAQFRLETTDGQGRIARGGRSAGGVPSQ